MEHRKKILGTGLFLLFVAFGSHALTLGRASSSALIGRPLDMVIPVQMDAGESAASLCFEAEVFHADSRQDASRVQVLVAPAAQPNMLNVRVVSAAAVDEPVVTVYLRTGCGQKTTRRYVLLADFPSEVVTPALPLVAAPIALPKASASAQTAKVTDAPLSAPVVTADRTDANRAGKASSSQNSANRREPKKTGLAPARAAATASLSPVQRSAGQPRLQLDPSELLSDRMSSLDGNMTFDAPPDALESIQKLKTLEDSLKSLRLLAAKNEASLNDMQARLQQAQASGFSSQTGYALMALALACLAAAVVATVLWRRQRQAQVAHEWWGDADADAVPQAPVAKKAVDTVPAKLAASPVVSHWPTSTHAHSRSMSGFGSSENKQSGFGVDVNLTDMTDSAFKDFMPTGMKPGNGSKLADLQPVGAAAVRSARNLNSDAVIDIRQQAEFFVSLGQTERAAQLLKREIKESHEPNPFVYLDLLALFHSLGLKSEFQQLRESFELLFCCRVPAFTFFKNRSLDLESYPDVLSHIVGIWSEPGVLAWLESCLFQNPGKGGNLGFDLAAFRDLLFLHAVARILAETPDSQGGSSPAAVAAVASVRAQPTPLRHDLAPFDALDLDLSTPGSGAGNGDSPLPRLDEPMPFLMPSDLQFDGKVKSRAP